jgi:uncharacterized membrane protein YhaH (DUF805 family)
MLIWLLTFEGRVKRRQYFLSGLVLATIKFSIDSFVASRFDESWKATNYIFPPSDSVLFGLTGQHRSFYLTLWAIAIPFFWIGISLTLRRLRDAGRRPGWIFLFFVPIANLLMFLYLSLVPSKAPQAPNSEPLPIRKMPIGATLGVVIAALLGLALELLSANYLAQYAWGLFLGVPFITGFVTSWFLNAGALHSRKQTIGLSALTPILIGLFLIGFRLEGLVCLLMALPLALPFSIAGGLVAHYCLGSRRVPLTPPAAAACVAIVPFLMFVEHAVQLQPPVQPVVTSIVVNAPVNIVWRNVIAFPPLAAPKEWIFHTGIAYPIGATITGSGPGAIRRCRFSTGDFVEPITVWDENHLLAFNVASQPPSLQEMGFGKITTPHIEGDYMRSQHGQFRLVALDGMHTLLEGTTWYQDYFWPQPYWRAFSDAIVHRIHIRVLEHVKQQAEAEVPKALR